MSNTQLTPYKENIFTKIINFFKSLFRKKQYAEKEENIANTIQEEPFSNNFRNSILYQQEKQENKSEYSTNETREQEKQRIMSLKTKYDNGEISIKEISDNDMEMLIKLYNAESEVLSESIERKTQRIINALNKLKETA